VNLKNIICLFLFFSPLTYPTPTSYELLMRLKNKNNPYDVHFIDFSSFQT